MDVRHCGLCCSTLVEKNDIEPPAVPKGGLPPMSGIPGIHVRWPWSPSAALASSELPWRRHRRMEFGAMRISCRLGGYLGPAPWIARKASGALQGCRAIVCQRVNCCECSTCVTTEYDFATIFSTMTVVLLKIWSLAGCNCMCSTWVRAVSLKLRALNYSEWPALEHCLGGKAEALRPRYTPGSKIVRQYTTK